MKNLIPFAVSLSLLTTTISSALASPVEVILEVELSPPTGLGEPTFNIVSAYGSQILGSQIEEQFFTSLQSKLFGHFRVLVDPENLTSIQFMPGGYIELTSGDSKIWNGVTTDTSAAPGDTPANLSGMVGSTLKVALRDSTVGFESAPMALFQPEFPSDPSVFLFETQQVQARMSSGTFQYENIPFLGDGSASVAGIGVFNNQSVNAGFFGWGPLSDPNEDGIFASFDFYYTLPVFAPFVTLVLQGSLQMEGRFSLNNIASVQSDGETVEVLGGPSSPGGVQVTLNGISEPGTFSAQQIGLMGLPQEALLQSASIADLAYSIDLLGDDLQIWNLNFTESFALAEVTLGFSSILLPALTTADDLVLYHFDETQRAWIEYTTPLWNLSNGTVHFETSSFSPFVIAVRVPEASTLLLSSVPLLLISIAALRRRCRR